MTSHINDSTLCYLTNQANVAFKMLAEAQPAYLTYEEALDLVLDEHDKQLFLEVSKIAKKRLYTERHSFMLPVGPNSVISVEASSADDYGIAPQESYVRLSAPVNVTLRVNEWLAWAIKVRTTHWRCIEILKWFTENKTPLGQIKFYFPAMATLCLAGSDTHRGILPQFLDTSPAKNPMSLPHHIRGKCRHVAGLLTMYKLIENSTNDSRDPKLLKLCLVDLQTFEDEFGSVYLR